MASAWIAHVKKYATEHKITYREALKKLVQLTRKNKNKNIFKLNFYIKYLKVFNF